LLSFVIESSSSIARKQKAARQFARSSCAAHGIWTHVTKLGVTRAMAIPWVADVVIAASLRDDFELPDYA